MRNPYLVSTLIPGRSKRRPTPMRPSGPSETIFTDSGSIRPPPRARQPRVHRLPRQIDEREIGGSHRPLTGTTTCPKRQSRDCRCERTPSDGRDGCGAGNRAARSRWVPAPIPGSVLLCLTHPRTTVPIGRGSGQHSRPAFDSDSMFLENDSILGQGIRARWT